MSYVLRDAFESSLEMYLPSVLQRIFVIQACNDALYIEDFLELRKQLSHY